MDVLKRFANVGPALGKSALQWDPEFRNGKARGELWLLLRSSASLCPALLQLLPQAIGLDQAHLADPPLLDFVAP